MTLHFDTEIAKLLGSSDKAVIVGNICYWIAHNLLNGNNYRKGRFWTYNTTKSFSMQFDYLSANAIGKILRNLVKDGVLLKNNFNKNKFDKTGWYSLTDKYTFLLKKYLSNEAFDLLEKNGFEFFKKDDDDSDISSYSEGKMLDPNSYIHEPSGKMYIDKFNNPIADIKHTDIKLNLYSPCEKNQKISNEQKNQFNSLPDDEIQDEIQNPSEAENLSLDENSYTDNSSHQNGSLNEQKQPLNAKSQKNNINKALRDENAKKQHLKPEFQWTLKKKQIFNTLSDEYKRNLRDFIDDFCQTNINAMSFENFANSCVANAYKYANFKLAYLNWQRRAEQQAPNKGNKHAQSVDEQCARLLAEYEAEQNIIDIENDNEL